MRDFNKTELYEIAAAGTDKEVNDKLKMLVDVDRRAVSRKETIGYMLFDGSTGFNVDGHQELFNNSYIKISLSKQSLYNAIAGVWDVVDDFLIGGLIEKSRTRWGKFVPYMFMSAVPYAAVSILYWLMPLLFSQGNLNNFDYLPKFILFCVIGMLREAIGNFKDIAKGGYLSTVTPYPSDRRRLLSITNYFSIIYSRVPDLIVEFMLDFVTNGLVSTKRSSEETIGRAFMIMGPFTMVVYAGVTMWYSTIAKERVRQNIETPKILDSLKLVFSNRPVLAVFISNALGSFGTGFSTNDYYRYVLFMTTFETIAGIPSVFFQPIGFANYNKLSKKYSTKSLYAVSQVFAKTFYIPIWFYGRFLKTKSGQPFFLNRWAMLPVTAVWECIYATFWGVRSISITEINNEINDYIEWKCGSRNEAMLSVAGTIITKIPSRINGILLPLYKKWIGFDQEAYPKGQHQNEKAERMIFAMCTIMVSFLVLTSMIPITWYNIDKETRDRMYKELNERRAEKAEAVNAAAENEAAEKRTEM